MVLDEGEDDEAAWKGWDVETDSSDESGSEGWISVDDGNDDLELSDSDDEGEKLSKAEKKDMEDGKVMDTTSDPQLRTSALATTKVRQISFSTNLRLLSLVI